MEARIFPAAALLTAAALCHASLSLAASTRTANFIVEAPTQELAEKIGKAAEHYRHDLAVEWLGAPLKGDWSRPCPIVAQVAPNLGAGGQTSFVFDQGQVFGWDMRIQGSEERVLDSVLPHEVTHTIFASYFHQPLPRWADEGACTTVEHVSERSKQQVMLVNFLRTNRGIAFDKMFAMREYPSDVLPLYSQGYSLARFLIDQWGRPKFLEFVGEGLKSQNWPATVRKEYGFANLQSLQDNWLEWVAKGSPTLTAKNPEMLAGLDRTGRSAGDPVFRAQSGDRETPSAASSGSRIALASASNQVGPPTERSRTTAEDRGWLPAEGATGAGQQSVYDRQSTTAAASTASTLSPATSFSPPAEPLRREPEFVAQRETRDKTVSPQPNHKVLLEWKRPE